MGKGWKRSAAFLCVILAAGVIGAVLAQITSGVNWLHWLSYGTSVGISTANPAVVDLLVCKIALGFTLQINLAQILCMLAAAVIFSRSCQ